MTNEQLKSRLNDLKRQRWLLSMKDMWNGRDYTLDDKLLRDIEKIEKRLKEMDS